MPSYNPDHSRSQRRGGSTKLFAVVSFGRSRFGAPLNRRHFERGGCVLPAVLFRPGEEFAETCTSLSRSHRHRQARPSRSPNPPDPLSRRFVGLAAIGGRRGVNLQVRGRSVAPPVRARRRLARERVLSCRKPRAEALEPCVKALWRTRAPTHPFALYRPVPRVSGATSFLQAERPTRHETLRSPGEQPREMRPTDVCHPIERRAPAPRELPAPIATFAAWTPLGE